MIHECKYCNYKTPMLSSLKSHLLKKNKCYHYDLIFEKVEYKKEIDINILENETLQRENETLQRENETLQRENETLQREIQELKTTNENINATSSNRKKIITRLKKEIAELQS